MKRLSFFISIVLISSSAVYGMDKGKKPAKTGLLSMTEMADHLEQEGSSSASPMSITAQLAPTPYTRYYFTPDIKDAFLNCIANEQEAVRGAFFRFTLYDAAKAIVKGMKEREITAKLVVDGNHTSDDFCSPLKLIVDNGGKVLQVSQNRFQNNPGKFEIMHHKFMIFRKNIENKKLLWTGSWNATGQASGKNCENVIITDDQKAVEKFEEEMIELKKISTALTAQACVSAKDTDHEINFARRMNGIPEIQ